MASPSFQAPVFTSEPAATRGAHEHGGDIRPADDRLVDQALTQGWVTTNSQRRRQSAKVQAAILAIGSGWTSPVPIQEEQTRAVRELIPKALNSASHAANARDGMTLLVLWWLANDVDFDLKSMLRAASLADFQDALDEMGYEPTTNNQYVTALDKMGSCLHPDQRAQWKAIGRSPSRKAPPPARYEAPEVEDYFVLAWAQPTANLRDGLLAVLCLALGAGVYSTKMKPLRGTDVRETPNGGAEVCVEGVWLVVRRRYAPLLLELARRAKSKHLVPMSRGQQIVAHMMMSVVVPDGMEVPKVNRLVATYRFWASVQCQLLALVAQCGPGVLMQLGQMYRLVEEVPPPSAFFDVLCPPEPTLDGPWAVDWPVRHHRQ